MCDYDVSMPTMATLTTPRARKVHCCDECRFPIAVGVQHERLVGCWEGRFSTYRRHLDCAKTHDSLGREFCGGDFAIGDLRDFLREHLHEFRDCGDREAATRCVLAWRDILRARRAEGVWPVRRAA